MLLQWLATIFSKRAHQTHTSNIRTNPSFTASTFSGHNRVAKFAKVELAKAMMRAFTNTPTVETTAMQDDHSPIDCARTRQTENEEPIQPR